MNKKTFGFLGLMAGFLFSSFIHATGKKEIAGIFKRTIQTKTPQTFCTRQGEKLYFDLNRFQTFLPNANQLFEEHDEKTWKKLLGDFTYFVRKDHLGQAISIKVPQKHFDKISFLSNLGYGLHFAPENAQYIELVYKNKSPMPAAFTSNLVVRVLLMDEENHVLAIHDRNNPHALMFPGGYVEAGEFVEDAAIRETYEEVGIKLSKESLTPIAFTHRLKTPPYDADMMIFYLQARISDKKALSIQNEELLSAQWVPLKDIVEKREYAGLVPNEVTLKVLNQVGELKSQSLLMLDPYSKCQKDLSLNLLSHPNIDFLPKERSL